MGLGHVPRNLAGVEDLGGVPGRHRPREPRLLRLATSSPRRGCRPPTPARDLHGQRQRWAGLVRRRRFSACREPAVEKGLCRQGCRDHDRARARRLKSALDRGAGNAGPAVVELYGGDGRGLCTAGRQAPRDHILRSWCRPGRSERELYRDFVDTRSADCGAPRRRAPQHRRKHLPRRLHLRLRGSYYQSSHRWPG